ncbi:unnamed protein product [Ostreobium quekettii]|uniref:UspA domain-containing protein n=1 Tax=Ostreobium quekettii TaxID=121088 RepID=A0A8S1IYB3_9CHLO|nr:unnamed protein product [Ostreobium quekettii]
MELQNGTLTCLPIAPLAVPQLREALGFRSAKRRAEHGRCRPARIAAREARPRWRVATRAAEAEREAVAARREENGSGRQLVVAVDDSEESEKALKWTVDNFYRSGTQSPDTNAAAPRHYVHRIHEAHKDGGPMIVTAPKTFICSYLASRPSCWKPRGAVRGAVRRHE